MTSQSHESSSRGEYDARVWRERCEAAERAEAKWKAAAEQATAQAARYAQALEDISAALAGPAPVNRARLVIAALDSEAE